MISIIFMGCGDFLSFFGGSDRFIVSFNWDVNLHQMIKELKSDGIEIRKTLDIIHGVSCKLTDIQEENLRLIPYIRYIELDYELFMLDIECPKILIGEKYTLINQNESIDWGLKRIKAPEIWNIATGKNVKIGVMDTGINTNHPDLIGVVTDGFDAIAGKSFKDDNNHGTYVASVIASRKNNIGIVGVAPEAILYSIKVMNSEGRGYISDILDGCQWAIREGLEIINMSLGSDQKSIALAEAIEILASEGICVISATGNEGQHGIFYPARNNVAICVGGSGMDDNRMSWSNYGPELKYNGVLAPGDWIQVADKDGKWRRVSGTSIATPHVTGIFALLMEVGYQNPDDIRKLIFNGSSHSNMPDEFVGYGIVNAQKSFEIADLNH
jgi:subtilisin family serine protease